VSEIARAQAARRAHPEITTPYFLSMLLLSQMPGVGRILAMAASRERSYRKQPVIVNAEHGNCWSPAINGGKYAVKYHDTGEIRSI
jgi:hypothetical protein